MIISTRHCFGADSLDFALLPRASPLFGHGMSTSRYCCRHRSVAGYGRLHCERDTGNAGRPPPSGRHEFQSAGTWSVIAVTDPDRKAAVDRVAFKSETYRAKPLVLVGSLHFPHSGLGARKAHSETMPFQGHSWFPPRCRPASERQRCRRTLGLSVFISVRSERTRPEKLPGRRPLPPGALVLAVCGVVRAGAPR